MEHLTCRILRSGTAHDSLDIPLKVFPEQLCEAGLQPRRHLPVVAQVEVLADRSGLARLHAVFALEQDVARRRLAGDELDDLRLEAENPQNHRPE